MPRLICVYLVFEVESRCRLDLLAQDQRLGCHSAYITRVNKDETNIGLSNSQFRLNPEIIKNHFNAIHIYIYIYIFV